MKKLIEIEVPVVFRKEGNYIVAYCPALELSSYGKTRAAAKKAFEGAMRIFVEETAKKGTLERELLSLGWSLRQRPSCKYQPPFFNRDSVSARRWEAMDMEKIRIPCTPSRGVPAYAGIG